MIKNIVFDMGKVLVDYREDEVCRHCMTNQEEMKKVIASVFRSQEWALLDMGVISEKEALIRMMDRMETEHEREMVKFSFEHWHEYNMIPMEEMGELVRELKKDGYRIYLCSNASVRLSKCYKNVLPGVECFDGILFSAEEKLLKPQKEIYLRLFEKFHLKPKECFFIDDLPKNIDGGRACGMDGYCFADGDIEKLRIRLSELNDYEKKARALFRNGYSCAQSVLLAFQDLYDMDWDMAARLSSSFGGGIGRLRETCGAVSGMCMAAGLLYGYSNPGEMEEKAEHYKRIQELVSEFKEENHSIICRELLNRVGQKESYVPEERTQEYYNSRPCENLVASAARILNQYRKAQDIKLG